jgi:menaquinone-dependent protoporphyrinogen oxidase
MKPVAILYATREGHTRRIAEHIAGALRARGLPADVLDVVALSGLFSPERHAAVLLAASVHGGHHEPEMIAFVKRHRDELESVPSAFVSVSLSEATVEDEARDPGVRRAAGDEVRAMIKAFFESTGWHPGWAKPVAGALLYSHYGAFKRFVMKRVVGRAGGPTDTSRDYEFTDWVELDRFVDEFAAELKAEAATATS